MQLAEAYVQIVPVAEGIGGGIASVLTPEAAAAGDEAGETAGTNLAEKIKSIIAAAGIGLAIKKGFDAIGDLASYGDTIDKQSQKIGISAKAYQEWDAVLQHSGTSINAMQSSMKKLTAAAADGSDAFGKLGISQEEAMSMSQEDLFARVIEGLQGMEEGTERAALAQDLLGRGAQEMAALLNTSAEDTQKMKDAVNELGGVMSDDAVKSAAAYQDALQDMQTAFSGLGRGLLSEFLPGLTEIMGGITQLFAGDGEGVQTIISGVQTLAEDLLEAVPAFVETGLSIVTNLIQGVLDALPGLWETATTMIPEIVNGFLSRIPELMTAAGTMMSNFLSFIMQNLPSILSGGIHMVGSIAQGILNNLPAIVGSAASIIARLLATLLQNAPRLLQQGVTLIGQLAMGIIRAIPKVVATVPQIFSKVFSAFRGINWGSIGSNIIDGIKKGITNGASKLVEAAKNMAKKAFDAAKNFLGIKSPSKKFEWIADMSVEGVVRNTRAGFGRLERVGAEAAKAYLGAWDGMTLSAYKGANYQPAGSGNVNADLLAAVDNLGDRISRMRMVTDTGALVGELAEGMNQQLGYMAKMEALA
jgi:phage-related protein